MTQEVVIRDEAAAVQAYRQSSTERLEAWVKQAQAVSVIAADICSTSFAPTAYRGKPAEATAAILAGAELGFDPMASLRAFDSIQGVPAPKAMTLRAVVQGRGHKVVIEESTAERAVVRGLRRGETEWQTSTWDIDRARNLDLLKKDQWQKQPQAMLVARATAEVCRWIASDAVMGMPYAAEEVGDFDVIEAPATRRLTVAELDGEHTVRLPASEVRKLTGGELDQSVDLPAPAEMVSDQQRKHMFALWRDLGFDGDANREHRLAITAKILGLPELESSSDLTRADADRVIAALIERKERTAGEAQ